MGVDLNLTLALVAGILTMLSPCVLPLLPIVLGAAQSTHRLGPAALGLGLAVSFTLIGLFVATIGFAIGLDGDLFRTVGGAIMILIGAVLVIPTRRDIDARLITGSLVFGAGWGLAGICPGPAIAALGFGMPEIFIFVAAMLAGMAIYQFGLAPQPQGSMAK